MSDAKDTAPDSASAPVPDRAPEGDQRRIAELEAEVSRLRGQIERGSGADDPGDVDGAATPPLDERLTQPVSRAKVALIIIVVALLVGGLMVAVFGALSASFESLAHKAADVLVQEPEQGQGAGVPPKSRPKPARPDESAPRAPGF